jgi:hypothetical protein
MHLQRQSKLSFLRELRESGVNDFFLFNDLKNFFPHPFEINLKNKLI